MLGGAEDGTTEGMVPKGGLVDQVLGHHRGLVVGPGDFLHHDPSLAIELAGVDSRSADEVSQQVGCLERALGPRGDVERDQVMARIRVQHRADPLGGGVDVAVGGVLLTAFEHQVLEEVGHAVLPGPLRAGPGVESHEDRHRPRPLALHAEHRQLVLQTIDADVRHRA